MKQGELKPARLSLSKPAFSFLLMAMPFWTYMLHCADRSFYVGSTDDLEKRMGEHDLGSIPGYTSLRRPVTLVWSQDFATREEARAAELRIKGWGRLKKLALIRGDWDLLSSLAKGRKGRASTSSAKPVSVYLHPHLQHLPSEPFALEVRIAVGEDRLHLRYRLSGPVDLVRIPAPAPPEPTEGLWRRTCFEAFVSSARGNGYFELNLAPSGRSAAYGFDSYRHGMEPLALAQPPQIKSRRDGYSLTLDALVALPTPAATLRLNLAAVIEEKSGRKSYWALAHPSEGPPDFHDPACFVLELPPP